jgi:hypothetical protein
VSAFLAPAQPLAIEAERAAWRFTRYLHTLAEVEVEERRQRRLQRRRPESALPAHKTLTSLPVARRPEPVRRPLPALGEGHFVDNAQKVLAFGLPEYATYCTPSYVIEDQSLIDSNRLVADHHASAPQAWRTAGPLAE